MKMTKMTALLLAAAMALTACGSTAAASSTAASEAASVETTAAPEATAGSKPICSTIREAGRTCRRNGGYLPADRYRPAGPRSYH